jgi:Leucine-rich repeat (LRR) protein
MRQSSLRFDAPHHDWIIQVLPGTLSELPSLKVIDASNNEIEGVEEGFRCPKLADLNLAKNKLTTLPKTIGDLASLSKLSLSHNQVD